MSAGDRRTSAGDRRKPAVAGAFKRFVGLLISVRDLLRQGPSRPLTRGEKIALALIVLLPTVLNAISLLSEVTIPVPSVNDDALHYLFIQRASDALANGENIFDHWLPQIEAGVPQFFYYQHLPSLVVVGLQRLSFGSLDLLTTFNLVRYVLMVGLPLTVFVSMRLMGFSGVASALGAAASTLLSGDFRYGFEYDSYTWRGFGLYTQLWAMHLSFLTLGASYRALNRGKGLWLAALAFGLLVLTHLIFSYMMGITVLVLAAWGVSRATAVARLVRLGVIVLFGGAISSYMWLPFLTQSAFLNATPYLQPGKYDSYGVGPILTWLFTGDLMDHGRLPVLTILLFAGIAATLAGWGRAALVSLGLFLVWLIIYFGRPTLGVLVDLFPLHDGLLFHRFIGGVDLAAILLMGVGGAFIWQLFRPWASQWRVVAAGAVLVAVLAPAMAERATFYSFNTAFEQRSLDAVQNDADEKAIIAALKTLPPGRVFAGLPTSFGNVTQMTFQDLHFYNLLPFNGIESLAPPTESMSLNSDYIWDFNEHDPADFDLWNVRYMVAPAILPVDDFLTPIFKTSRYVLYSAPTSGYAEYGGITARRAVATQSALFTINRAWERDGSLPAEHLFMRYDYPSSGTVSDPSSTQPCPDGGHFEFESFRPGKIDLVVSCPAASTLIIKTTYHPNWQVVVDGAVVPDFMVSPSFIGVNLGAGTHSVSATYVATPIKTPLLGVGLGALVALLVLGWRLDGFAAWVAGLRVRRRSGMPGGPG